MSIKEVHQMARELTAKVAVEPPDVAQQAGRAGEVIRPPTLADVYLTDG